MVDRILQFFTSLRVTVVCLGMAVVLVFVGTVAQAEQGLYQAQARYFKSFFVNKELGVLCWPDGLDIAAETLYHKTTGEPLPTWLTGEKPTLVKG